MINIIKPELLGNRLDADFYQKDFIGNELILSNFGSVTLSNLIDVKKSGYGVLPKSDEYLENGLPLIRGGDLSFGRVQEICVFVPEYYKDSRAIAKTGDVLILIKGACIDGPEGVARIGEAENGYLYNGSCYRLSFKQSELDGYFFIAYSQTKFFLKQKKRQIANTGISYNDESSILNYLIPNFTAIVKKYIGDKVRQAELLREFAKFKQLRIDSIFNKKVLDLGYKDKAPTKYIRCNLDNRLDPAYYAAIYSFLDEEWFKNSSQKLKNYIANGSYGVLPNSNSYGLGTEKFIRATDLSSANINPKSYILVPFEEVSAKAKVSTGDILLEIKGAISECQLATSYLNDTYVNGSIYRFKPKDIDAAYLTFYLRSFIKKLYCDRVSVNNIISYLDLDSINNLPILRLDAELENIISEEFLLIELAKRLSFRIVKTAQYLVEALIEDVITEEELIQAQNALAQGDASLDRAILSQITENGYAVADSKPLFADLDEFYDLLEQAKALE